MKKIHFKEKQTPTLQKKFKQFDYFYDMKLCNFLRSIIFNSIYLEVVNGIVISTYPSKMKNNHISLVIDEAKILLHQKWANIASIWYILINSENVD